ncbi:hypothetical protein [Actinomadura fulvescens]|uniref:hypothetical protein n=1 Tax=Actinomadura fulvescens TaxID=46160 RepID=UPI0031DB02D6
MQIVTLDVGSVNTQKLACRVDQLPVEHTEILADSTAMAHPGSLLRSVVDRVGLSTRPVNELWRS